MRLIVVVVVINQSKNHPDKALIRPWVYLHYFNIEKIGSFKVLTPKAFRAEDNEVVDSVIKLKK